MTTIRDDRQLLEMSASGDEAAFSLLYDRHAETVARYTWGWFADRGDVQEVVQETFVTVWQKAATVRLVDSSALPWILATAKNHARNRCRKIAGRRETPLESWTIGLAVDTADVRAQVRWVLDEIAALSDVDRRLCERCLLQGYSYKEAAKESGQTVAIVAKRLERAKARIRKAVVTHD